MPFTTSVRTSREMLYAQANLLRHIADRARRHAGSVADEPEQRRLARYADELDGKAVGLDHQAAALARRPRKDSARL
jgi:hypothetical protein